MSCLFTLLTVSSDGHKFLISRYSSISVFSFVVLLNFQKAALSPSLRDDSRNFRAGLHASAPSLPRLPGCHTAARWPFKNRSLGTKFWFMLHHGNSMKTLCWAKEDKSCMIPFIRNTQNRGIHPRKVESRLRGAGVGTGTAGLLFNGVHCLVDSGDGYTVSWR